jgi:hypothetical protein
MAVGVCERDLRTAIGQTQRRIDMIVGALSRRRRDISVRPGYLTESEGIGARTLNMVLWGGPYTGAPAGNILLRYTKQAGQAFA